MLRDNQRFGDQGGDLQIAQQSFSNVSGRQIKKTQQLREYESNLKPANASDVEDEEFSGDNYDQEDDADSEDDEYVQSNKLKGLKGAGRGRGGRAGKTKDYEPPSKRAKHSHPG